LSRDKRNQKAEKCNHVKSLHGEYFFQFLEHLKLFSE
jgi:hypothetical protein